MTTEKPIIDLSYHPYQVMIDGQVVGVSAQSLAGAMREIGLLRLDEENAVITFYGRKAEDTIEIGRQQVVVKGA